MTVAPRTEIVQRLHQQTCIVQPLPVPPVTSAYSGPAIASNTSNIRFARTSSDPMKSTTPSTVSVHHSTTVPMHQCKTTWLNERLGLPLNQISSPKGSFRGSLSSPPQSCRRISRMNSNGLLDGSRLGLPLSQHSSPEGRFRGSLCSPPQSCQTISRMNSNGLRLGLPLSQRSTSKGSFQGSPPQSWPTISRMNSNGLRDGLGSGMSSSRSTVASLTSSTTAHEPSSPQLGCCNLRPNCHGNLMQAQQLANPASPTNVSPLLQLGTLLQIADRLSAPPPSTPGPGIGNRLMVQRPTANVALQVEAKIVTIQDDSDKLQACLNTQKEHNIARSMNSEKCFSECHDSDLFYFDAEFALNSLSKGDAVQDTLISSKDAHVIGGQQTAAASTQQENEHAKAVAVGTIPPVVQVVKHVENKIHANDSRDDHVCDHPESVNLQTPTLIPRGVQLCKLDNEAQLPSPCTAMVAQDLCKTDAVQPSQGTAENVLHAPPHATSFGRDLQQDTTAAHDSKPTTPSTNPSITPWMDCGEEENNHTQQEDEQEMRPELARTKSEDSMIMGFTPTVSLGAVIGACIIMLV